MLNQRVNISIFVQKYLTYLGQKIATKRSIGTQRKTDLIFSVRMVSEQHSYRSGMKYWNHGISELIPLFIGNFGINTSALSQQCPKWQCPADNFVLMNQVQWTDPQPDEHHLSDRARPHTRTEREREREREREGESKWATVSQCNGLIGACVNCTNKTKAEEDIEVLQFPP